MHPSDTPSCFASHMGMYFVDPSWMSAAMHFVRAGQDMVIAAQFAPLEIMAVDTLDFGRGVSAQVTSDGVAVLSLSGVMSKAGSAKFGGASTVGMRNALRSIRQNDAIKAVVLSVDSPGGQAAGTAELAADYAALAHVKPTWTQIEDQAASAGAWVALSGGQVAINAAGRVGSFGTVITVEDTSAAAEREGVKVHVISTGPLKGAFAPGTEITDDQLGHLQEIVRDMNQHFMDGVQQARGLSDEVTESIWTGGTFNAKQALDLGLVDHIQGLDETIAAATAFVRSQSKPSSRAAEARAKLAQARR